MLYEILRDADLHAQLVAEARSAFDAGLRDATDVRRMRLLRSVVRRDAAAPFARARHAVRRRVGLPVPRPSGPEGQRRRRVARAVQLLRGELPGSVSLRPLALPRAQERASAPGRVPALWRGRSHVRGHGVGRADVHDARRHGAARAPDGHAPAHVPTAPYGVPVAVARSALPDAGGRARASALRARGRSPQTRGGRARDVPRARPACRARRARRCHQAGLCRWRRHRPRGRCGRCLLPDREGPGTRHEGASGDAGWRPCRKASGSARQACCSRRRATRRSSRPKVASSRACCVATPSWRWWRRRTSWRPRSVNCCASARPLFGCWRWRRS